MKGSFTGAYRDKPGKLEMADNGTIFLDEIGEMTLRMQGLLLRFLETGEIQKVGAERVATRHQRARHGARPTATCRIYRAGRSSARTSSTASTSSTSSCRRCASAARTFRCSSTIS